MNNKGLMAFLAVVFCLCATISKAQSPDTLWAQPNEKAMALTNRIEQELHLSSQQKEKTYLILLDRSLQREKSVKPAKGAEKQKYIEKLNAKNWKGKVLTDEQKQQYQQLRKELKLLKEQEQIPVMAHDLSLIDTDEDLELDF